MGATLAAPTLVGVSLVNAILLLWLGLTVLLNAERRVWALWLTSGALLAGSLFFLIQAAVATREVTDVAFAMRLEWPAGWLIGLALPFAWYASMLWHGDFWDDHQGRVHQRHRLWLVCTVVMALAVMALIAPAMPSQSLASGVLPLRGVLLGLPLLAVAYALFIVLCVVLSLDVLLHVGPSRRFMRDLARRPDMQQHIKR